MTGVLGLNSSLHYSIIPVLQSLIAAAANLGWPAGGLERFFAELDVDDLLVGRFLVGLNVAVLDSVIDRPFGAFP